MLDGGCKTVETGVDETTEAKNELSIEERNALVVQWIRYIRGKAGDHFWGVYHHDLSYDDLFQAGVEGAIKASRKFDPERGNTFITYAADRIIREIRNSIENEGKTIRIPRHIQQCYQKVWTCEKRAGRKLSIDELSKETGITRSSLKRMRDSMKNKVSSLEKKIGGDDSDDFTLSDLIPNTDSPCPEEVNLEKEKMTIARELLNELKARDPEACTVIKMSFGFKGKPQMNNVEIGEELGVSHTTIRNILKRGIGKLRPMYRKKVSKVKKNPDAEKN